MNCLDRFFAFNRRLSSEVESRLPDAFKHHLHTLYKYQVAAMINRHPGQLVLDVGGGKECPFLQFVDEPQAHIIVALDCSEQQLRQHHQLALRIVGDAALSGFPLRDGSVDLVVSRSVVEHIPDNSAYFKNCARALRPGGIMVHAFPGRFAPFALLNQVLPNRLVRRLIGYFLPEWVEEGNYGFVAFYNRCYYTAIRDLIGDNRLTNPRFVFTYYQALYFTSFFPLYCVMVSFDLIAWGLGIRNLASGILVMAEREEDRAALAAATARRTDILPISEIAG
jgi:SAM-dependent methyltransferase